MNIFAETNISSINLKNRIIRSATYEGMGDEKGFPEENLNKLFTKFAKGGVGAIITGFIGVHKLGMCSQKMCMIDDDKYIESYKQLNDELNQFGTPVIAQLAHCGANSKKTGTGTKTLAPSDYKSPLGHNAREMSEDEIEEVIESFVNAITRAQKSGFSGVQLHGAHIYLLAQFLSPHINKRKDTWGGSLENRFRIIKEIIERARKLVGDYPILIKISAYDYDKNGMRLNEGIEVAKMIQDSGFDAIEVSCGGMRSGLCTVRGKNKPIQAIVEFNAELKSLPPLKKNIVKLITRFLMKNPKPLFNYNIPAAKIIKKNVDIPVIVVGGIRNANDINEIISNGKADFVSLSRPFIIEPGIVNKFKENSEYKSKCINCSYCLFAAFERTLRCDYGKIK
ncbi:MAG: NADH:flavin oxidoreductase [bacterium]|nr:NADH:flavin oxidoreductase [bacterium]